MRERSSGSVSGTPVLVRALPATVSITYVGDMGEDATAAGLLASHFAPALVVTPALEQAVEHVWVTARAAWPTVDLTPAQFMPYLAARMAHGVDARDVAGELLVMAYVPDLYLACGCLLHDAAALVAFEASYMTGLRGAVHEVAKAGIPVDEVKQTVREKLFVGSAERRPTIAEYAGRGPLSTWVYVVATRVALNLLRATKAPATSDDAKILSLPAEDANQELAYLKRLYQQAFAAALADAMASLPERDQTLLRQHYVDGVTLKQLAKLHGVHRVTLVHRAERAREALRDRTHQLLLQRLGITPATLESIAELIRSEFGANLARILSAK